MDRRAWQAPVHGVAKCLNVACQEMWKDSGEGVLWTLCYGRGIKKYMIEKLQETTHNQWNLQLEYAWYVNSFSGMTDKVLVMRIKKMIYFTFSLAKLQAWVPITSFLSKSLY